MRTYKQVINQILNFANSEEQVRVVMLNGSRVNSNAPVDIMQDYDVVFFINAIEDIKYKRKKEWINQFGDLVILQQNDFEDGSYVFLLQYQDIRIDLSFCDINKVHPKVMEDSLTKILLDKDGILDELPPPSDKTYYTKKPAEDEWNTLLNELWWIQTYVAKGIWRDELPLTKYMYDVIFMNCLRELVTWHIGLQNDWNINVGKCGKWFKELLDDKLYSRYVDLYISVDYEEIWNKLFKAGEFIRDIGIKLSDNLGYDYPKEEDVNVTQYLKKIRDLPSDAKQV